MKWLEVFARLIEGAINAYNAKRKKDATNNPANTIANNDDRVQQSEVKFSDLANKSKRD